MVLNFSGIKQIYELRGVVSNYTRHPALVMLPHDIPGRSYKLRPATILCAGSYFICLAHGMLGVVYNYAPFNRYLKFHNFVKKDAEDNKHNNRQA
jgi:hypothetical protein